MKSYPSIPGFMSLKAKKRHGLTLYTFDKADGSNLRFEWSKKRGWYKFGTRRRLFDETDSYFGEAIPLFMSTHAEWAEKQFVDNRYERAVLFCEFWGHKSFAGNHVQGDEKFLTPFDVDVYKRGLLPPKEFLKLFGHDIGPKYLGLITWDSAFLRKVTELTPDEGSMQAEGVVGKTTQGKLIKMYKFKSQWWKDTVFEIHGPERGAIIANS